MSTYAEQYRLVPRPHPVLIIFILNKLKSLLSQHFNDIHRWFSGNYIAVSASAKFKLLIVYSYILITGDLTQYKKYGRINHCPFKSDVNVPHVLHMGKVRDR